MREIGKKFISSKVWYKLIATKVPDEPIAFYQSSMGATTEQLSCQVHRSQYATTTPLIATPSYGHPPTIWESLPTEWG
jgi:predicted enzyme related to lactoylglutathione lyase